MNFRIRPMRLEDIPQVAEIEREAFPTTWPPTPFRRELTNRLATYLVACTSLAELMSQHRDGPEAGPLRPFGSAQDRQAQGKLSQDTPGAWHERLLAKVRNLVARPAETVPQHDLIAGYVGVWFMVDEAHIISIAVREAYRRMGLGELLMIGSIESALAHQAQRVTLEVRVSNLPAQALYEKYGFRKTGVRKGYYADNHEDAVIMTADSILSPSYRELFRRCVDAFRQRRGDPVLNLV